MLNRHDTVTGYDFRVDPPLGRAKSIRKKCLECSTTSNEVRQCTISDCPLWPYRFGRGVLGPLGRGCALNTHWEALSGDCRGF